MLKKKYPRRTAISLFSGMGGDSLGLVNAGFKLLGYSEINKEFRNSHDLNFPSCEMIGGDILTIPDEKFMEYENKVDVLFAGFPCQGFSNAGKKMPDDPRNTLFKEFIRATKYIKPNYIIGENVKGLLNRKTSTGNSYINIIEQEFTNLGYDIRYKVFKAHDYNVPQKRERLIIIGVKTELNKPLDFPEPNYSLPISLVDIVKFDMSGSIKVDKNTFDMTTIPSECILTDTDNDETDNNPHPYLKMKVNTVVEEYNGKTYNSLISFSKRDSPIHCEIIDIRNPSKTIICSYDHQPRLFVPLKNKNGYYIRCLLPEELKQIQGFPKEYQVSGNLKQQIVQIGNAVPPPLIEAVVRSLIHVM
jgi:DNA (cytosine-5)-methyltransferase 1